MTSSVLNPNNKPTQHWEWTLVWNACQEISVVRALDFLSHCPSNEALKIVAKEERRRSWHEDKWRQLTNDRAISSRLVVFYQIISKKGVRIHTQAHIFLCDCCQSARAWTWHWRVRERNFCFLALAIAAFVLSSSSSSGADNHFPQYAHYS